ncbi:tagaturonate reductase [Photobacterium rosenbergii]|uniref:Tagaturonate reductase n=1 Tax=Photobacterium rosenbergii TaxID=294936 RepID=A0ABU3ZI51_9GAMM|nr:tagaturonate reductase [Photobacterium rosenbergii]MDV5169815.1 tagaturonate reductase [Photobacterium rosenbergii]
MATLNRTDFQGPTFPTKVLQFGEGNFMRAFVDWQLDLLNEQTDLGAGIAIVRPIDTDFPPLLNEQDGLYTTVIRGINEQGEAVEQTRLIRSVNEEIAIYQDFDRYMALADNPDLQFVFSNTTEAGISFNAADKLDDAPASSFPAKLTQWLYARFRHFAGAEDKGLFIIPCELIDYNGDKLKEYVLAYAAQWQLEEAFSQWLENANTFCSTLVDRIVTGHPRDEHAALQEKVGYQDQFMVTAEYFYLFVIQGPQKLAEALRLSQASLNIKIVDDIKPYKERKVAILNGAHTAMVPVAYLCGIDTVGEAMEDADINAFVRRLLADEVIPVLDLPQDELEAFAASVIQRFQNPYIKHQLISISLNSMTKFRTRLLPQLEAHLANGGKCPELMALSLAAQLLFYCGRRGDETIALSDDQHWLDSFAELWQGVEAGKITTRQLAESVLGSEVHWGTDLTKHETLITTVTEHLSEMVQQGMRNVVKKALEA